MTARLPQGLLITPVGIDPSGNLYALAMDTDGNLYVNVGALPAIDQLPAELDSGNLKVSVQSIPALSQLPAELETGYLKVTVKALTSIAQLPSALDTDRLKVLLSGAQPQLDVNIAQADEVVTIKGESPSFLNPLGSIAQITNTHLAAGSNDLDVYTVPAGQRIIARWLMYQYGPAITGIKVAPRIVRGGVSYGLPIVVPTAAGTWDPMRIDLTLEEGDIFRVRFLNCLAEDDGFATLFYDRIK